MQIAAKFPPELSFLVQTSEGEKQISYTTDHLVVAGWVGRDKAALEAHIQELELLGIARPSSTPIFYRVSSWLVTQCDRIQVAGREATGEAEVVLFRKEDELLITIGSDHTDRKLEVIGVTLSKQVCSKPVADKAWPLSELRDHWDQLTLRSWIEVNGERILYQDGLVASMLQPWDLLARYESGGGTMSNGMMFCGTLSVIGGIRWSDKFFVELNDPVRHRSISFSYSIEALPVLG